MLSCSRDVSRAPSTSTSTSGVFWNPSMLPRGQQNIMVQVSRDMCERRAFVARVEITSNPSVVLLIRQRLSFSKIMQPVWNEFLDPGGDFFSNGLTRSYNRIDHAELETRLCKVESNRIYELGEAVGARGDSKRKFAQSERAPCSTTLLGLYLTTGLHWRLSLRHMRGRWCFHFFFFTFFICTSVDTGRKIYSTIR